MPPVARCQSSQHLLSWLRLGLVHQDPFNLLLNFSRQQQPSVVKHPHLVKAALVEYGDVFALIHMLKDV